MTSVKLINHSSSTADWNELVLFDSLSPYCEASVKVFLSLQKTSCIIKTYLYQKDEVSLIIHSIQ